ncbi:hypothetical protein A2U01_0009882 [Trifolium medium]|uniref:Gag-pol polyprotein n=1 Tax=Trifolium medium TaxID=97028 RepID=A0A392MPU2_9FABA|nr:hypothetical protein [Trifolium medium]
MPHATPSVPQASFEFENEEPEEVHTDDEVVKVTPPTATKGPSTRIHKYHPPDAIIGQLDRGHMVKHVAQQMQTGIEMSTVG